MSWGGWKPFVSTWGAFKCGMGIMDTIKKSVFQPFLVIFGDRWMAVVAHGVFVRGHEDERQHRSCHVVAENLLLAHGAHLSVEWGLWIMDAKFENMCFSHFWSFLVMWVAVVARGVFS
jgi:hypothetical protein